MVLQVLILYCLSCNHYNKRLEFPFLSLFFTVSDNFPFLFKPGSCHVLDCNYPCLLWFSVLFWLSRSFLVSLQPSHCHWISCRSIMLAIEHQDVQGQPFSDGYCLYIGWGHPQICALSAIMNYLHLHGHSLGPLFLLSDGQPLSHALLTHWLKHIFAATGI